MKAVILGSTGAVGTELTKKLIASPVITQITLLVRRPHPEQKISASPKIVTKIVDVFNPESYRAFLPGHELGFSTFGVGQPSKISQEEFFRTDFTAALHFAEACKAAGIKHFSSLGAVGTKAESAIFYLKTKGQLEEEIKKLGFERTTFIRPSTIITPQNRYGFSQALVLKLHPLVDPLLCGKLTPFRSIKVEELGAAMGQNALLTGRSGVESLTWQDFKQILRG